MSLAPAWAAASRRLPCVVALGMLAASCGVPGPGPIAPVGIGDAGGTVNGPEGATASIPAGALATTVAIGFDFAAAGEAPALPEGYVALGKVFALTPHGATFAKPVTVTVPFEASIVVPPSAAPLLLKTTMGASGPWAVVEGGAAASGLFTANLTGFSFVVVAYEKQGNATLFRLNLPRTNPTAVAIGPGGGVYVAGLTRDALDQAVPGGGAFIARYDAAFALQWAHVFPAQAEFIFGVPRLAADAGGNACLAFTTRYTLVAGADGPLIGGDQTDARVHCFDPQGNDRAGFPKQVSASAFDLLDDVQVSSSGNIAVLFTAFTAAQAVDHRPWFLEWTGNGTELGPKAPVAMGTVPAGHRVLGRRLTRDASGNLLVLAHQVAVDTSTPETGFKVQQLTSGGGPGVPIFSAGAEPAGLTSDASGNLFVLAVSGVVHGYRPDGSALAGYPVQTQEGFGTQARFEARSIVTDDAGAVFVGGLVEGARGSLGNRDIGLTSLTAGGVLRSGFPRVVGTSGDDGSSLNSVGAPIALEPGANQLYVAGRVQDGEAAETAVVVRTPSL